jgi:hypothetical protein
MTRLQHYFSKYFRNRIAIERLSYFDFLVFHEFTVPRGGAPKCYGDLLTYRLRIRVGILDGPA